ncbi:hypothetical protein, partial [Rhodococcoides fascians]|uniref:hypothetical protein n=1 Tax=Rhodococcoides fascians TaxID=1828 RepID=UPI0024BB8066
HPSEHPELPSSAPIADGDGAVVEASRFPDARGAVFLGVGAGAQQASSKAAAGAIVTLRAPDAAGGGTKPS